MSKVKEITKKQPATLQLFSLQVEEKDLENIQLNVLKFPKALQDLMYQHPVIKNELSKWKGDIAKYYPFAQSTAFKLTAAIFPNILYANNNLKEVIADKGRWFYYLGDIDLNKIKRLISDWLKQEAAKRDFEYNISEEDWVFEIEPLELKDVLRDSPIKYRLIPAYYSYIISRESFDVKSLERNLNFSRCHNSKQSASLLSDIMILENGSYFAYEMELTLVSPIDSPCDCLNVGIKIKRFHDQRKAYRAKNETIKKTILSKDTRSLYVYRKNRYYKDDEIVFNALKVSCSYGKIKFKDVASEFFINQMKIPLDDFLTMPENYLPGKGDFIVLLGINGNESAETLTGAGIPERNELFELISERLSPLKRRNPLKKVKLSKSNLKCKGLKEFNQQELLEQFSLQITTKTKKIRTCPLLLNSSSFNIGVFTDNEKTFEEMVTAIRVALYLNHQLSEYQFQNEAGLTVSIFKHSNAFTCQLETGSKLEKIERYHQIKNEITSLRDQISACIIEIGDYHNKSNPELDTKLLTRAAFMSEGLLTQFVLINDSSNSKLDTYLSAVYDLLSVSGFRDESLCVNLKEDVLLGLSNISTQNNQHRFAFTKINQHGTWIRLYPSKEWTLLPSALTSLTLNQFKDSQIKKLNEAKAIFKDWVSQTLTEVLNETNGMTYFFMSANLRKQGFFPLLMNSQFQEAEQRFSEWLHISNLTRIRFIRVSSESEVPFYYIRKSSDLSFQDYKGCSKELKKFLGVNRESGVFKSDFNTYYLAPQRNDTSMQVPLSLTKINSPEIAIRKQTLLETTIKGTQDEKELDYIANLTQDSRKLSLTYKAETQYPLPIQILHYLSEYLLALDEISDNK